MATTYTDESFTSISSPSIIPSTDYIGNSLSTINGNFDTLYQDILFLQKQIANIQTIPVGTIAFFAMQTAPTGWLLCDGSLPTNMTSLYPALYNLLGTTYGAKGTLPDLRGQFIRGWNSTSKGLDANRTFGQTQTDAYKSHTHNVNNQTSEGPQWIAFSRGDISPSVATDPTGYVTGANGNDRIFRIVASGDTETRPRNIALLGCIKW